MWTRCISSALVTLLSASAVSAQMPNLYGARQSRSTPPRRRPPRPRRKRGRTSGRWRSPLSMRPATSCYFQKMDGTQTGSVNVAIDKARSAALFKRPTKAFQDTLAAGGDGLRILALHGALPDGRRHAAARERSDRRAPSAFRAAPRNRTDNARRPVRQA